MSDVYDTVANAEAQAMTPIERVAVRLQDRSLMPTMNVDVTIIGDVDAYWKALAKAAIEATGVVEMQRENERLRKQLSNSIQFAGGQSPLVCGGGSISSRTVYSVGEALTQLAKGSG